MIWRFSFFFSGSTLRAEYSVEEKKRRKKGLTSSSCAEGAVVVAARDAFSHHLAVDVLGIVGVDVAGAAAAVRDFCCHGGLLRCKEEMSVLFLLGGRAT